LFENKEGEEMKEKVKSIMYKLNIFLCEYNYIIEFAMNILFAFISLYF